MADHHQGDRRGGGRRPGHRQHDEQPAAHRAPAASAASAAPDKSSLWMKPIAGLRWRRPPKSAASRLEVSTTIGAAPLLGEAIGDRETVDVRQHDVEQHDLRTLIFGGRKRRDPVTGLTDHREPVSLQQATGEATETSVVVDDQHRPRHVQIIAPSTMRRHWGHPQNPSMAGKESGISSMRTERDATSLVDMVDRSLVRIGHGSTKEEVA